MYLYYIMSNLFLLFITIWYFKGILYQTGEDLCKLDFGAFLRFVGHAQLLSDKLIVKWLVEKLNRLCLVKFGQVLKCESDVLSLILLSLITAFRTWSPCI